MRQAVDAWDNTVQMKIEADIRISNIYSHIQGLQLTVDSYNLIKFGITMKINEITPPLPFADQTIRDLNEQWLINLSPLPPNFPRMNVPFGPQDGGQPFGGNVPPHEAIIPYVGLDGGVESESSNVIGE
ncbi:hypothetical protein Q3G72_014145 [Acer saccharum]|nr:hypothetical protein Q3G72_014145 [Acer saccharum]